MPLKTSLIVSLVLALAVAAPALAHDDGLARVGLKNAAGPEVAITLDGRIKDLAQALGLPEDQPIPGRAVDALLPPASLRWLSVVGDGAPCALSADRWSRLDALALRVELRAACAEPVADLRIGWAGDGHGGLRWSALVVVDDAPLAESPIPLVLDRVFPQATLRVGEPPPVTATLLRFGRLGVVHILTGWDHLAFLLALLMSVARARQVLVLVTAFTVAHSITLGLGATGVVELDPAWVEPIIGLSIAVAAALVGWRLRRGTLAWPGHPDPPLTAMGVEVAVCLAFGLVHGFGFAGLLAELLPVGASPGWPLLGFNLGVELGQVACVAIGYLGLVRLGRTRSAPRVIGGLVLGLVALGLVITVARLL